MMRAAGYTSEKDFFKAVEAGKIMASEVMPKFADELKKVARTNGALEATTKKTRAEMQRFFNQLTYAKDAIFQGGMDEGLGYMFGSLADLIKELEPLAKAFGAVFRGAITTITAGVKIALTPFRGLVDLFESLGDNLERLGILDGTGGIWSMVGAGGVIALMATKFSWLAKAIWTVNAALLAMMARFAPIIAAYAVLEDLALYATYGDKADTITGRAIKGLQAGAEQVNPRGIFENLWKGYSEYSPVGFLVNVSVNDSELSKVISANVEQTNQKKAAINQTETSQ